MEATESFLPATTSCGKTMPENGSYFDFTEQEFHGYKPCKPLPAGYLEPNNNNNSDNSMAGKPHHDAQGFGIENSIFWSDKETVKMEPELLDDLNAWAEWGDHKGDCNTDGTVYTLTVLNSNEWYKSGSAGPSPSDKDKKPETVDINSFLNIMPETDNSDSSGYYYPEFSGSEFNEAKVNEMVNNNDWKTNNMNESLLRSALQGKRNSYKKVGYSGGEGVTPPAPPQSSQVLLTSPYSGEEVPNNIDDILGLSTIESFDDYEKIKKIANEVADCAKYSLNEIPPINNFAMPVDNLLLDNRVTTNNGKCVKRYGKKGSGGTVVKSSSSTRKERSLHYCSICSKGFKDKYSVNVHVRTHTGEKPFTCTLCGKSFRQKAHLAKHYQTHLAQSQKHLGNGNANSSNHSKSRGSSNKVIETNR